MNLKGSDKQNNIFWKNLPLNMQLTFYLSIEVFEVDLTPLRVQIGLKTW